MGKSVSGEGSYGMCFRSGWALPGLPHLPKAHSAQKLELLMISSHSSHGKPHNLELITWSWTLATRVASVFSSNMAVHCSFIHMSMCACIHLYPSLHLCIHPYHVYSCIYLATYYSFIYPASHKPHPFTHHPIYPAIYPSIIFTPSTQSSIILLSTHHLIPLSIHLSIHLLFTHHPTISLFTDPSLYLPPLTYAPILQIFISGSFIASPKWEDSDKTRRIILGRTAHQMARHKARLVELAEAGSSRTAVECEGCPGGVHVYKCVLTGRKGLWGLEKISGGINMLVT